MYLCDTREMPGNGFRLNPDFRKLWIGQAISQIGSNIASIGQPLTAVLSSKRRLFRWDSFPERARRPYFIFGLFAGARVDRLRRRPILIAADLGAP
jgi:hypothetical protein